MRYGKIEVRGYPSNIEIFAGENEERGRVVHMECTGDVPYCGIIRGTELASYVRGLSRRGQIEFIKRHS